MNKVINLTCIDLYFNNGAPCFILNVIGQFLDVKRQLQNCISLLFSSDWHKFFAYYIEVNILIKYFSCSVQKKYSIFRKNLYNRMNYWYLCLFVKNTQLHPKNSYLSLHPASPYFCDANYIWITSLARHTRRLYSLSRTMYKCINACK